VKGVRRSM